MQASLEVEILADHKRNRKTYGAYPLQSDLADHGMYVGFYQLKRIKKKLGIHYISRRFGFGEQQKRGRPSPAGFEKLYYKNLKAA